MSFSVEYITSERDLHLSRSSTIQWSMNLQDPDARLRSQFLMHLDPTLDYDTVASLLAEQYRGFSCRFCHSPLISDGSNGSGTGEFFCGKCRRKMSLYNTFELSTFRYRKILVRSYHMCTAPHRKDLPHYSAWERISSTK